MARREFPRSVRVAKIKAQTRESVVYCELCGLPAKRWHFDHVIADAIGGEPVLSNCQLVCEPCHAVKTKDDVAKAAKAKRVEARHVGAVQPRQSIASRGFPKKLRGEKIPVPPRRSIYV